MSDESAVVNDDPTPEPTQTPEPAAESSPPPEPKTVGADPGTDPEPVGAPQDWPDNWRDLYAKGNEDDAKRLKRWNSPGHLWQAYRNLEKKFSSDGYQRAKPDTDDAEALKAWRAEIGIPETPEGYLENIKDVEIPDHDQPIVDKYLERMHAEGASAEHVKSGLNWYYEMQGQIAEQQQETDKSSRQEAEDELRAEWGQDYRGNINGLQTVLEQFGQEGLKEQIFTARDDQGVMLGNNPAFLRFLANIASDVNPMGTVTAAPGENPAQKSDERIAELQMEMRDTKARDENGYWANPAKQEEYARLLEQKERIESRRGAA